MKKFKFYVKKIYKKINLKEKIKQILRNDLIQNILGFILSLYIRLIYLTSRIYKQGSTEQYLNLLKNKQPTIVMCWHGRMFISGVFIQNLIKKINYKDKLLVLSSKHKDGEIASKTLNFFNFQKIGGSTINPTKLDKQVESGAIRSIIIAMRELKNKKSIFLAPDGPRGPKYQMNSSIVEIGQKSNAVFFPVSVSYSRKITLKTWDEFHIPLPFGKILIEFLPPIELHKNDNTNEINKHINNSLNEKMKLHDIEVKKL